MCWLELPSRGVNKRKYVAGKRRSYPEKREVNDKEFHHSVTTVTA